VNLLSLYCAASRRGPTVVLADWFKSFDWRVRKAEFICKLPQETTNEVLDKRGCCSSMRFKELERQESFNAEMDKEKIVMIVILLKNPRNASTRLSMNGKTPMISTAPPFVLRLSKDERGFFSRIDCYAKLRRQIRKNPLSYSHGKHSQKIPLRRALRPSCSRQVLPH